jgi:hypothetical protein
MYKNISFKNLVVLTLGVILLADCQALKADAQNNNTQTNTLTKNQQEPQRFKNVEEFVKEYQDLENNIEQLTEKAKQRQIKIELSEISKISDKINKISPRINENMFHFSLPERTTIKTKDIQTILKNINGSISQLNVNAPNFVNKTSPKQNITKEGEKKTNERFDINNRDPINNKLSQDLDQLRQQTNDLILRAQLAELENRINHLSLLFLISIAIFSFLLLAYIIRDYLRTRNIATAQLTPDGDTPSPRNQDIDIEWLQSFVENSLKNYVPRTEWEPVRTKLDQLVKLNPAQVLEHEQNVLKNARREKDDITEPATRSLAKSLTSLAPLDNELVENYNRDPTSLSDNAIEVSATENSITHRRLGVNQAVVLEKVVKGRGLFWVLPGKGFNYLVPKKSMRINEYNRETVEALFLCKNYQSGATVFRLNKPGKVVPFSQGETWQLVEQGEVQFE